MYFYGIKDFYDNRLTHKTFYMCMTEKEKKLYKRFVYSISFENEYVKDIIWEYLNSDEYAEETIEKIYVQRLERGKKWNIIVKKLQLME